MYTLDFQKLSMPFLKEFTVPADTTCSGKLFHALITLLVKKRLYLEVTTFRLLNLSVCPLVLVKTFFFEFIVLAVA